MQRLRSFSGAIAKKWKAYKERRAQAKEQREMEAHASAALDGYANALNGMLAAEKVHGRNSPQHNNARKKVNLAKREFNFRKQLAGNGGKKV